MATLARAKVYRNVERRQEWLGLEPLDALGLGAVFWLLMVVNRHGLGWNLLLIVAAYAGLRALKRGRPEGHSRALVRFYLLRRPFFSAAADDPTPEARRFPGEPGSTPRATGPR